jgi:two-component system sensor histidine kinase BaeS
VSSRAKPLNRPRSAVLACKLWCAALLLAACETGVNFEARPGLNWSLSTLAAAGMFAAFLWMGGKALSWQRLLPLLLACALAGGAAITASAFMDALVLIGTLGSLAAALLINSSASVPDQFGTTELLLAPAIAGVSILREARRRIGEALAYARADSSLPIVRGIALASAVTFVFSLLLSNADPLLAYWRDSVVQSLRDFSFLSRTTCFTVFGMLSLGSFGIALTAAPAPDDSRQIPTGRSLVLGSTERRIVLWAVVSLFGSFLTLELSHLFGNAAAIRGDGVTYAQTAHQGFAELSVVASLCAALLIALTKSSASRRLQPMERALSVAVILQAQLLLLSAFHRMQLYEDAYGFTELRLLVQIYIGIAGVALAKLTLETLGSADFNRLARRCAVMIILALTGLVYWNHAGWIAQANLRRYERTGMLDVAYVVVSLGPDAVPELVDYLPQLPPPMRNRLRSCLHNTYASTADDTAVAHPWYEWSYRRSLLESALSRDRFAESADARSRARMCESCCKS